MKLRPKIFTLEEANALIPELDQRLARIIRAKENYDSRHDVLLMHELITEAEEQNGLTDETFSGPADDISALEEQLNEIQNGIEEIGQLGCLLRDLEHGCVDFLSKKDNELVYFCWRRGENKINSYRGIRDKISQPV